MEKKPFVTKEQLDEIVKKYPTPFHLYDEKGIRENAEAVEEAFAWNPGFREYFAVKATPNPFILNILKEYDCGCDCSSLTELMLADSQGFDGQHIMFSSNDTPWKNIRSKKPCAPGSHSRSALPQANPPSRTGCGAKLQYRSNVPPEVLRSPYR